MFLFVRWGRAGLGDPIGGRKLREVGRPALGQGVAGLNSILLRQVPIHGDIRRISAWACRASSIVSSWSARPSESFTEAIPATLLGAGLVKASAKEIGRYLARRAVAFAILLIGATAMTKSMKQLWRRGGDGGRSDHAPTARRGDLTESDDGTDDETAPHLYARRSASASPCTTSRRTCRCCTRRSPR